MCSRLVVGYIVAMMFVGLAAAQRVVPVAQPIPKIVVAAQPEFPVKILSVVPADQVPPGRTNPHHNHRMNKMSGEVASRFDSYTSTVKNVSKQDVYLLSIQWDYEDPPGRSQNRRTFTSTWNTRQPVLMAGDIKTETHSIARREYPVLRPVIDLVVLGDGSAYGKNQSRALEEFQAELITTASLQKYILAKLESDGLEWVKQWLRSGIGDARTKKLLHVNRVQ